MKESIFTKLDYFFIVTILITAFLFRSYKLTAPLADFHSWRQADTASGARNFVQKGFDLLRPRYHDLSNIQSGKENPQGYRMVEFPLYNALFAYAYKIFPITTLEVYGRLTSIFFSLMLIGVIYYFLKKEINTFAAFSGSFVYATFPFFVYFSRVILPDIAAVSLTFVSLFFLYKAKNERKNIFLIILSSVLFSSALLIKPTVIFFSISFLYLFYAMYQKNILKRFEVYLFATISLLPLVLWRSYIQQFPEGIPFNEWLISHVNTYQGLQNIFFRPAFFRWIFFERINNIILGGFAAGFFFIGLISKQKNIFLHSIAFSSFAYLFTFQGGNVQHEYYQILILPALAIFCAIGIVFVLHNKKHILHPAISYSIVIGILAFSFFISQYRVKDYYNVPQHLLSAARIISNLTLPEDKIVTDTTGDTTLLYLANRTGSPAVFKSLEELKKDGYRYFFTDHQDVIPKVKKETNFKVVFENDQFTLFSL